MSLISHANSKIGMENPLVNIGKEHIPHHKIRKETKSTYEEYFF